MALKRHRKDLQVLNSINLTSLLDVAFVLLIAFMIVAPSIRFGLDLELPAVGGAPPEMAQRVEDEAFVISLPRTSGGVQEFLLNEETSTLGEIERRLVAARERGERVAVQIEADRTTTHEAFIQVLSVVRRAGVTAVGLPVEAADLLGSQLERSEAEAPGAGERDERGGERARPRE